MNKRQSVLATLAALLLLGSGMALAEPAQHDHHAMAQNDPASQPAADQASHTGFGVLRAINLKDGKVQIAHEAIATLQWPPMTMWFALRDPLPQDIKVGDEIRFELRQAEKKQWVIVRIVRK